MQRRSAICKGNGRTHIDFRAMHSLERKPGSDIDELPLVHAKYRPGQRETPTSTDWGEMASRSTHGSFWAGLRRMEKTRSDYSVSRKVERLRRDSGRRYSAENYCVDDSRGELRPWRVVVVLQKGGLGSDMILMGSVRRISPRESHCACPGRGQIIHL